MEEVISLLAMMEWHTMVSASITNASSECQPLFAAAWTAARDRRRTTHGGGSVCATCAILSLGQQWKRIPGGREQERERAWWRQQQAVSQSVGQSVKQDSTRSWSVVRRSRSGQK